jgi:hypothetical protein
MKQYIRTNSDNEKVIDYELLDVAARINFMEDAKRFASDIEIDLTDTDFSDGEKAEAINSVAVEYTGHAFYVFTDDGDEVFVNRDTKQMWIEVLIQELNERYAVLPGVRMVTHNKEKIMNQFAPTSTPLAQFERLAAMFPDKVQYLGGENAYVWQGTKLVEDEGRNALVLDSTSTGVPRKWIEQDGTGLVHVQMVGIVTHGMMMGDKPAKEHRSAISVQDSEKLLRTGQWSAVNENGN